MIKKLCGNVICMILLYVYIYSPALQLLSFGLDKIVFVLSFVYLLTSGQLTRPFKLFKKEYLNLFLIILASFLVTAYHRGISFDGILMYDVFLFFEVILVPYAFYCYFVKKCHINIENLLINNAIIASIITILLLINPTWADIMKNQILRIPDILLNNFDFRGFGFSDGLTFGYPVVQGFCASFIVAGIVKKRSLYFYIALLPMFVSVFVNARSGLIPVFIAFILILLRSSIVVNFKFLCTAAILSIIGVFFFNKLSDSQLAESVEWGLSTFKIIGDMLSGNEAENVDVLFHDMVQFPISLSDWLVGTGYNLFQDSIYGYRQSDIGFCIRSVYGGMVYMSLWLILWVTMYKRIRNINRILAYIMFGSLLYLNWKSDFFVVNTSCRFFFLVYVLTILDSNFLRNKKLA